MSLSGLAGYVTLALFSVLIFVKMSAAHVVDLSIVRPGELERLWQHEAQSWQERLLWDISDPLYRLQRMVERGSIAGKTLRDVTGAAGYACYMVAGKLGVISRLVMSPECDAGGAEILIRETVGAVRRTGASRIECPFISIDSPSLPQLFEQQGFHTYWREFLRCQLYPAGDQDPHPDQNPQPYPLRQQSGRGAEDGMSRPGVERLNERGVEKGLRRGAEPLGGRGADARGNVYLEPWRGSNLRGAASLMRAAYEGGVDAEMNEQYRSDDGCELMLDDILNQGGCGNPVVEASAIARHRGRGIGFTIVTEIAHRHAHLAQVAVLPEYQYQGVGRLLLRNGLSKLADQAFDTVSLIVSRRNRRALNMYELIGFKPVSSFPAFTWQG
jgi:GNAT superfamily N-acetyltransferase